MEESGYGWRDAAAPDAGLSRKMASHRQGCGREGMGAGLKLCLILFVVQVPADILLVVCLLRR